MNKAATDCFGFALLQLVISLKYCAIFSTNQQNQNQLQLGRVHFPLLGADDMYLLSVLIGSLECLGLS